MEWQARQTTCTGEEKEKMGDLYCQSCGMPLENNGVIGTNQDGSVNYDYCIYCYQNGAFTQDVSMDEMIAISLGHMRELFQNDADFNEENALSNMQAFFPKLKRWRKHGCQGQEW